MAKFAMGHRYLMAFVKDHKKTASLLKDMVKPGTFAVKGPIA